MSVKEPQLQNGDAPESKAPVSYKRNNYLHWDDYFMATSLLSAKRSKDPVTQVGACIVDSQNRIVAIGYNGFPRNCSDDEFPWSKAQKSSLDYDPLEDKKMYVVHAEANAILNSNGASLTGTRLYTTLFPCNECAKLIIQVMIRDPWVILKFNTLFGNHYSHISDYVFLSFIHILAVRHSPDSLFV